MRRPLLLVALFFIACSGPKDETPPPGDGTGNGDNPPASAIQGSLTVHTRLRLDSDPDFGLRSAHVLLGDGSRFKQAIDANGDVRFTDPAITGPQTVTVVRVRNSGDVAVETFLGIEKPEFWTQSRFASAGTPLSPQGTLQGRVTGGSGTAMYVIASGGGRYGSTQVAADGTYSLALTGPAAGAVDLVAYEPEPSTGALRIAIKRGVSTSAGQTQGGQDLVLEQRVEQPVTVNVGGAAPYGGTLSGTLHHTLGSVSQLFETYAQGTPPLVFSGLPRTAPFDVLSTHLTLTVGRDTTLPNGETRLEKGLGTATTDTVTLLGPVNITAPTVGTSSAPVAVSRANLALAWTVDPATQVGGITVTPSEVAGQSDFTWRVQGPPTLTAFTFFPLPSDVAPITAFPAGQLRLDAFALSRANLGGYMDHFVEFLPIDHSAEYRVSEVRGFVRLE